MDIRQITASYSVTPQIDPADMAAIRDAGFTRIICNRPDAEIPPHLHAAEMAKAASAAGLEFEVLPLTHDTMTPENIARQMSLIDASGPVLAYCASGTRCSVIWSLGKATEGELSVDEILSTTARAGYDLSGLRPRLEQIAG
ncbi:TIGR01244 family protein [Pseudooceanicola antarcticus]|uniref:TIGR01244 family phosphatase n=1 Tax=Pseudooceanicola antarcticus TaxID=1247613 RepID=A0A285JFA7_9RHOB|nr:TIGR01244 family sulfur transferase [Pseudooceanicola antarcticus]PJE31378.1 TIGR01244 family phosphatase [Pseudooceanicola antarcticus]SNY58066.1 TIGR01244 family protein [Pseudooceanicola antarcticus]